MIEALISSRTRINLLLKFFLNPENTSYLRELAEEFDESTNGIRVELNRFEQAGMLTSHNEGNRKLFRANRKHPFFYEIHSIIIKYTGIDKIIEHLVAKIGMLEKVYLSGNYARGLQSDTIEVILLGELNHDVVSELMVKAQKKLNRKISYQILPVMFLRRRFIRNRVCCCCIAGESWEAGS
ncbi:MAG: ArsR family transcriptional regulator [Bacteroidetes bacterium]|nr:ArsR family transcriptional regulator [Bacteroidota bacterium]